MREGTSKLVLQQLGCVTAKDELLWRDGHIVALPEADQIARKCGFLYVERLVKYLEHGEGAPVWEDLG